MKTTAAIVLMLLLFTACGGDAPKVKDRAAEPFIVKSSLVDPATNTLIMSIQVDPPVTEENVKTAAQMVIDQNKERFTNITVKSYVGPDTSKLPYGTSKYVLGSAVLHQFNPQMAPQKIETH